MFYTDGKLQYTVRVDSPNPLFARQLQQAIGGVEGEIRVAMQYFFQAWGARGPKKYRDLLLNTATEELAHIEMLSTAVALNLEGGAHAVKKGVDTSSPAIQSMLGGINQKNFLSSGNNAMPIDSDGVPFDMSHIYASGNLMADMYANVAAVDWPAARDAAVRADRRPGHEGHALLPDRARCHAPAAVAARDRGARRVSGAADPELLPGGTAEPGVRLRVRDDRGRRRTQARGPLVRRPVAG